MFQAYELRVCDGAMGEMYASKLAVRSTCSRDPSSSRRSCAASSCERHNLVIVDLANCTFMDRAESQL